jgi:hypothetical protein
VRRFLWGLQRAILVAVFAYLAWRLIEIGPGAVLGSLPKTPWFYIFFALRFLALPVCEVAAYEINWDRPLARHFPVFVRKRVYNYAVAGYSGEGFLTLWARRSLGLSDRDILIGVKDNNLLAAFTGNVATVLLIVALGVTGVLEAELKALPGTAVLFGLSFFSAAALSIAVVLFRRKLIALPDGKLGRMLALHVSRQALVFFLQVAMYASAIPGTPLLAWVMFSALQLVISRIPFLPNQELIYFTAALSLSSVVGAPETQVAGMLIAEAGLSQIVNFGVFLATAYLAREAPRLAATVRSN